jgi:hypothetical protein
MKDDESHYSRWSSDEVMSILCLGEELVNFLTVKEKVDDGPRKCRC